MTEAVRKANGTGAGMARIALAGHEVRLLAEGALHWPGEDTLVVADLHLEKGSSYARRRVFLPPYDTAATLAALGALIARLNPARVIALGDSFHDNEGAGRLSGHAAGAIAALQRGREWIWIAGNHDPDPPEGLEGVVAPAVLLAGVTFRHEPRAGAGGAEVAGHLHPAGKVRVRGGAVRRRCFIADEARMILPAFGAYTGGLNVLDKAFSGLFPGVFHAFMLGDGAVYPVQGRKLLADG